MRPSIIILPGIGGSGAEHWQTRWEKRDPAMVRFQPSDWDRPDLENWIGALDRAVAEADEPPILVAHSLACLLVAHWAARDSHLKSAAAFLVAVPDPRSAAFPVEAASFAHVPDNPLPFPALIVASTDDPFASLDHVRRRAKAWGAGLEVAGALGHINTASGLGDWPQGAALFDAFRDQLAQT